MKSEIWIITHCLGLCHGTNIIVTSYWARWRLKLPASTLFTQPFIQAQIKENIKAPRHWHLWGNSTVIGEFPAQMAVTRKMSPYDDVIMRYVLFFPEFSMPVNDYFPALLSHWRRLGDINFDLKNRVEATQIFLRECVYQDKIRYGIWNRFSRRQHLPAHTNNGSK